MDEQRQRAHLEHDRFNLTQLEDRRGELHNALALVNSPIGPEITTTGKGAKAAVALTKPSKTQASSAPEATSNGSETRNGACSYCSKMRDSLRRCSECKAAWYCDRKCQAKAWSDGGHRQECRQSKKNKDASVSVGTDCGLVCSDDNVTKSETHVWYSSASGLKSGGAGPAGLSSFFRWDKKETATLICTELESVKTRLDTLSYRT